MHTYAHILAHTRAKILALLFPTCIPRTLRTFINDNLSSHHNFSLSIKMNAETTTVMTQRSYLSPTPLSFSLTLSLPLSPWHSGSALESRSNEWKLTPPSGRKIGRFSLSRAEKQKFDIFWFCCDHCGLILLTKVQKVQVNEKWEFQN